MRGLYALFITSILGLLFSAFSTIRLYEKGLSSPETQAEILALRRTFLNEHPNHQELRLEGIPQELLNPSTTLPHYHKYPYKEIQSLMRYADNCQNVPQIKSKSLKKAFLWHFHLCTGKPLPEVFFETSPYMHPNGRSFVALAEKQSDPRLHHYLHLLESKEFSFESLEGLSENDPLVVGSEDRVYFFERLGQDPIIRYGVFPKAAWEKALQTAGYITVPATLNQNCLYKEGSLCWKVSPAMEKWRTFSVLGTLFFALILSLNVFLLFLERRKLNLKDAESRYFLLQTLTHELRTPIATLQLCVESFRNSFDQMDEKSQVNFLRLCDETQRLNRLVQSSVRYLNSHGDGIRFHLEAVPSVNSAVLQWLEPYTGQVAFRGLSEDRSGRMDLYWLGLCVKNLIENALSHGKKPIAVEVVDQKGNLRITVLDHGQVKSPQGKETHKGLGLGLSIVKKAVEKMNGSLEFEMNPTRFTIELKDC